MEKKLSPVQEKIAELMTEFAQKLEPIIRRQIAEEVFGAAPAPSVEPMDPVLEGLEEPEAAVVRFVYDHPGSTPQQIAEGAGLNRGQVKRPLTRLVESGRLVRRGRTRSVRYFASKKETKVA